MTAGMDLTPLVPPQSRVINSYYAGGFKISGERHSGSLVVTPDSVAGWDGEISESGLAAALAGDIEILLIGTGASFALIDPQLRMALRQRGIAAEAMTTPSACRTYNVLLTEGRRVATALVAMPQEAT